MRIVVITGSPHKEAPPLCWRTSSYVVRKKLGTVSTVLIPHLSAFTPALAVKLASAEKALCF